jgi:arabinoxylan arabinofuranohydrolase
MLVSEMRLLFARLSLVALSVPFVACAPGAAPGGSGGTSTGSGGTLPGSGGAVGSGGATASGGALATGGATSSGGAPSSGGESSTGGETASGGAPASNCTPSPDARARNALVRQIFTADPSAAVYGDRIYVYTSHDADGQMDYDMIDYHAYSSDDLVNWQDHGVQIEASSLPWATNLYAPGACEKDGQYYLYIPNSGSGIGVAVSDDPGGPFVDPLGEPLVTKDTPGVADVDWLFDPACFVDTDGQGYLYFGGGPEETGDNARVMRLGDDMISLADASATTIAAPAFFEASFMHKRGSLYYFSYSTNFVGHAAYIDYLTSDNPMTGFTYQGTILGNGNINMGNNNHASIVEFGGKSYMFYHNRKLEQELGGDNSYQRSIAVQEITYEGDAITQMEMSLEDTTVQQIKCLDGFSEVEAERMAAQNGLEVDGDGEVGVRLVEIEAGDWVGYSQVDFREGASAIVLQVAAAAAGGTIDVRIDGCDDFTSAPGSSLGTCEVMSTGDADTVAELSCPLTSATGPHDLCLAFGGTASFELDSFHLE